MKQHSLAIFWLLLAATICISAVAFAWVVNDNSSHANLVFAAVISGELSVICIWSGLTIEKNIWSRLAAWLAVIAAVLVHIIAAAVVTGKSFSEWSTWHPWWSLPTALHAALLLATLWIFERTSYWRRRTNSVAKWRFSLGQLLSVTTAVAVIASLIHGQYRFYFSDWSVLPYAPAAAFLGISSAIIWSLTWHWFLRFALALTVAIALGVLFACFYFWGLILEETTLFSIQAIILSSWLALAPVLPDRTTVATVVER
jgi:hypothetical protein